MGVVDGKMESNLFRRFGDNDMSEDQVVSDCKRGRSRSVTRSF